MKPYTVAQLIAELEDLDPEMIVVLSRDAEENGASPLETVTSRWYHPDTSWSGYLEPAAVPGASPAVVLKPTR